MWCGVVWKEKNQDDTHVFVCCILIQKGSWECHLECRPCDRLDEALGQDLPEGQGEITPGPTAVRGIEYDAIQPRNPDVLQQRILALGALRVAQRSCTQTIGLGVDKAQVAKVELEAEDVDPGRRIAVTAGLEGGRLGGALRVRSQGADGRLALGGGARGREEDEVGGEGSRREEFVNETFADAETNAAGECNRQLYESGSPKQGGVLVSRPAENWILRR